MVAAAANLPSSIAGRADTDVKTARGAGPENAKRQPKLPFLRLALPAERYAAAPFDFTPVRAYFCLKRSTRPAVSTIFCFPVQNGWHSEHTSTWYAGLPRVERVVNLLPQEQVTATSA